MLFVSAIEPAEYHKKRVIIADTDSPYIGYVEYGDSVSNEVIRRRAVMAYESTDDFKRYKRERSK